MVQSGVNAHREEQDRGSKPRSLSSASTLWLYWKSNWR
jgi:hypothetical protein